jgi:hypothetical protein
MKNNEWFKIKAYPHIDLPLAWKDKEKLCSYIKNKKNIEKHSFLPFIHKTIVAKKIRKVYDSEGNLLNKGKREILKPKVRDIYFANHLDSNIFSYYAHLINKKYEKELEKRELEEIATAYRKIPLFEEGIKVRNKCNIDFANDVFKYIKNNSDNELVAIAFDIKGFFDNLKHDKLKKAWCSLYNIPFLDKDHYTVYKNITKFSYVEENDLFNLFKDKIIVKNKSGNRRDKKIKKLKHFKTQRAIAFCDKKGIHEIRRKGLIRSNKWDGKILRDYGICQGSPISSVLANIYMLDFDELINNEIKKINGIYRRYSDDMVVVCQKEQKDFCINLFAKKIEEICDLKIQTAKTQIFHFVKSSDKLICGQEFDGKLNKNSFNRNFEYLGFRFDGETVALKTSSLAKYYRKMKLNARRCKFYAKTIKNKSKGQIFKRRLFKKFSYIGARRAKKFERVIGTTDKWRKTEKYNWGNYITYAKLAEKTFSDNVIKGQIKKHWKNLNKEIEKASR